MSLFKRKTVKESEKPTVDPAKMIREGMEYAAQCGYAPEMLHCGGCPNSCVVAQAKCTRGRELLSVVESLGVKCGK